MKKGEREKERGSGRGKPSGGKRLCSTDTEFEKLYLPGTHEKKKIQEVIRDPGLLKEHILKGIRK